MAIKIANRSFYDLIKPILSSGYNKIFALPPSCSSRLFVFNKIPDFFFCQRENKFTNNKVTKCTCSMFALCLYGSFQLFAIAWTNKNYLVGHIWIFCFYLIFCLFHKTMSFTRGPKKNRRKQLAWNRIISLFWHIDVYLADHKSILI